MRDKVRERSRTTEVMLAGAIVRAVEGDTLVLSHESAPLAKRLNEQRNADVIREALKDALGVDWKVRCEVGLRGTGGRTRAGERRPRRRRSATTTRRDMLAEAGNDTSEAAAPRPRGSRARATAERTRRPSHRRRLDLRASTTAAAAGRRRRRRSSSLTARTWCS